MISTVLLVQQSNRCLWYCVLPGTYARTTVLPGTVGVCPSRDVTLADRTNSPVEINRRTGYMVLYTWYTNCSNNPFKKMWVDVKTTAVEVVWCTWRSGEIGQHTCIKRPQAYWWRQCTCGEGKARPGVDGYRLLLWPCPRRELGFGVQGRLPPPRWFNNVVSSTRTAAVRVYIMEAR